MTDVPTIHADPLSSWIAGEWRSTSDGYVLTDPASGQALANVSRAGASDVDDAVEFARAAFNAWRHENASTRSGWCRSASDAILRNQENLARTLAREHGKPLAESRSEVAFAARGFEVASQVIGSLPGHVAPVQDVNKRVLVRREGLGVWAAITPWNFPVNIPVEYLAPALATGNAVVWKPSPTTAMVAAQLREVLLSADFPQELIQLVLTDDTSVAAHLAAHPGIDGVGFTGGSETGARIARAGWDKKLLLELGGNSPVIVLADADLERAADAIADAAFFNAGQVCSAAGKILAPRSGAEELARLLADRASALVIGDPVQDGTTLGPVHLESGISRYAALVSDALDRGARVWTGGERMTEKGAGQFYAPTIMSGVGPDAAIFTAETFGPVASITGFSDEDEMIAMANAGDYGLVGAVFTASLADAFRIGERIDCGLVVINASTNYWEHTVPFGGAAGTRSGRGRLGAPWVIDEFSQIKTLAVDVG
jgi:acyl-CoA reductase-like NAD-dependent aldehyde dehydrogenase